MSLGGEGLDQLPAAMEGSQIIVSSNVLLADEDVGDCPVGRLVTEIRLDFASLFHFVEFDDLDSLALGGRERGQQGLGLFAVRAPAFAEDDNVVLGDSCVSDLLGCHSLLLCDGGTC